MSLAMVLANGCGGRAVDLNGEVGGGGGVPATGSSTVANTSPSTAYCYGEPPLPVSETGMWKFPIDAFGTDNPNCVFSVPMPDTKMLAPQKIFIYFPTQNGQGNKIPFVGALSDCAGATTYGGWYATNLSGGSSDIGLCPCSCAVAHKNALVFLTPKDI